MFSCNLGPFEPLWHSQTLGTYLSQHSLLPSGSFSVIELSLWPLWSLSTALEVTSRPLALKLQVRRFPYYPLLEAPVYIDLGYYMALGQIASQPFYSFDALLRAFSIPDPVGPTSFASTLFLCQMTTLCPPCCVGRFLIQAHTHLTFMDYLFLS